MLNAFFYLPGGVFKAIWIYAFSKMKPKVLSNISFMALHAWQNLHILHIGSYNNAGRQHPNHSRLLLLESA